MQSPPRWYWLALASVASLAACNDLPVASSDKVELAFSIYSVNGQSPDAKTQYSIGGDRISIPRGSLLLHADGTVEERLQYVITRFNTETIAATDTAFGHYQRVDGDYVVRLPNAEGAEIYSGSLHPAVDFVQLDRSWKKNGVTVSVIIIYAKS